jgi:hypothetical protein
MWAYFSLTRNMSRRFCDQQPSLFSLHRAFLAEGNERNPVALDALRDQIVHRGLRAPIAEREVVLLGAALVGVTTRSEELIRVRGEPLGARVEDFRVSRANRG